MSFDIEYNRVLYRLPVENEEDKLILLVKQGSNNLWEHDNSKRVRDWNLEAVATEKGLWKGRLSDRLSLTCGGSLKRSIGGNGYRDFEIEEYIKLYRSKIRNAKPVKRMLEEDFSVTFVLAVKDDGEKSKLINMAEQLLDKFEFRNCGRYWLDNSKACYKLHVMDADTLRAIVDSGLCRVWGESVLSYFDLDCKKRRV